MFEFMEIVRKIQSHLHKIFLPILKTEGFTPSEMLILMQILKKGFFRPMELAKQMDIPASTFTGIVDRLVDKGYLLRETDPGDRRSVVVKGTPILSEKTEEMRSLCEAHLTEAFKSVPPEVLEQTMHGLKLIHERLAEDNGGETPDDPINCLKGIIR